MLCLCTTLGQDGLTAQLLVVPFVSSPSASLAVDYTPSLARDPDPLGQVSLTQPEVFPTAAYGAAMSRVERIVTRISFATIGISREQI